MEKHICNYGCGQEAIFQLKNEKWCCSKSYNSCSSLRKKNSESNKKAHERNPEKWFHKGTRNWDKLSKEEISEISKKAGKTLSKRIKEGTTKAFFKGRKHSKETKQKISNKMLENNNGLIKTKWYEIFCPYLNKMINVQGTWELKYATYLNNSNINWIRSKEKKYSLKYQLNEDDYVHSYYPDFYLPDTNEFIEIKGYMWKSKDGRIDDKRKMQCVIEQNEDKTIILLMKQELKELGVL